MLPILPILAGQIIDSDCSGLIPPCWQEIHYLFAGIMIGTVLGFIVFELLHSYWAGQYD